MYLKMKHRVTSKILFVHYRQVKNIVVMKEPFWYTSRVSESCSLAVQDVGLALTTTSLKKSKIQEANSHCVLHVLRVIQIFIRRYVPEDRITIS